MAGITGARTTTNLLSDQLAIDISDSISLLEPNSQALKIWTSKIRKRRTVATKFSWIEDTRKARFLAVAAGGALVGATTINVTAGQGTYVQQWDQLLNTRTGEQFRVDAVATDALTVTRGIGSTATAMNAADELYLIGTAQPENDTSKPARSDNASKVTNNTQIFRTPVEASDSLRASGSQVSPADWSHQNRKAGIEHAVDIELSFLFGRKSATTPGATEDRTTGGVLSFITSNQTDAGGDLSEAEFNAFMAQAFRFGGKNKLLLASATVVGSLNKFPAAKQQTVNNETTYGMDVTRYAGPFGALNLVYHPLLEGSKYGGYGILIDMDEAAYRPLGNDELNRDTKVLQNRQPNDQDGQKNEILTEAGLQFGQQRQHAVLTGVTS